MNKSISVHSETICAGLATGEVVFTTFSTYQGKFLAVDDHLDRLQMGWMYLYPNSLLDWSEIKDQIKFDLKNKLSQQKDDVGGRIVVFDMDDIWKKRGENIRYQIQLFNSKLFLGEQAKLKILNEHVDVQKFYLLKNKFYPQRFSTIRSLEFNPFTEYLFCSSSGEIFEAATSNIFLIKNRKVMTPSLNSNVFNGITRKLLLKYFTISGWDVGENSLFLKDLENADEVFLTNCSRGIISISEILGHNMKLNSNVTNEILYNLKLFMQGPAGD